MRFGIFYEHQLPRPWGEDGEHRLIQDALEQVALADRVGIDCVWEVEHHFLEEYSHSQRLRRLPRRRLAAHAPHPPRASGSSRCRPPTTTPRASPRRWRCSTSSPAAASSSAPARRLSGMELEGFGVDRETKRAQWEEGLDVVTRMMVEEPFAGVDGRFVSMPPRNVVPKPRQKPHPPLWVACSRRETIRLAAEKGVGALSFSFVEPEEARAWVDEYHAIIASERCVPGGFAVNPRVAVVAPDDVRARRAARRSSAASTARTSSATRSRTITSSATTGPARTNIYEEFLAPPRRRRLRPLDHRARRRAAGRPRPAARARLAARRDRHARSRCATCAGATSRRASTR